MNKKNISPEPGLRLRNLREKLGLSRAEFAEITGMSANTMRSVEAGTLELTRSRALMYIPICSSMYLGCRTLKRALICCYTGSRETTKQQEKWYWLRKLRDSSFWVVAISNLFLP